MSINCAFVGSLYKMIKDERYSVLKLKKYTSNVLRDKLRVHGILTLRQVVCVCVCVCVCVYIDIYTHTHTHTQGVPGGMCQTSGECSLS